MPDYAPKKHELQMLTDFGKGIFLNPVQFFETTEEVVLVDTSVLEDTYKTIVIRANGLVVLPQERLDKETAKAYKKLLPEALRRAGVLAHDEGIVGGPVIAECPPLDGGAVDGDVHRLVVDVPSDGEIASRVESVLQALGCSFRPVDGDGIATA